MFYASVLKMVAEIAGKVVLHDYVGALKEGNDLMLLIFEQVHDKDKPAAHSALAGIYGNRPKQEAPPQAH